LSRDRPATHHRPPQLNEIGEAVATGLDAVMEHYGALTAA